MKLRSVFSFERVRAFVPAGVVLLPAVLALVLYEPVLRLPLIYDTLLHIRITGELDWGTVWLPTSSFGFYRPLTFVPLLLIKDLFGGYPVWLLQGMNWLQHGINVALLGWLVYRLWPDRPWRTLFTGLLFALFPFSYQAVAVYGHNVHPATTGLLLVGLHFYLREVRRNSGELRGTRRNLGELALSPSHSLALSPLVRWLPTTLVFVLALLSHESALLFGALAALVEGAAGRWPLAVSRWPLAAGKETHYAPRITSYLARLIRYAVRSPWFAFLVLGAGYFVLYQFLPISRAPQAAATPSLSLGIRGLYLLQAAAYPFAWFASLLPQNWGIGVVLLGAAATLLLTLFTLRHPAYRWPLLLGWGWWSLAALVIAIPLPTDYLLHGPRLLYLSSVGLAIAWGVLLDRTQGNAEELGGTQSAVNGKQSAVSHSPFTIHHSPFSRPQSLSLLVSLIFLAFILITTWQFVRARLGDYARLTSGVAVAAEAMATEPATSGITLINLPDWLARPRATYPIGAELEQMLGGYLFAEELMAHNLGVDHPVRAVVLPELLQMPPYNYGLHDQHPLAQLADIPITQTNHFFVTRYLDVGPLMSHVGWVQADDAAAPPLASFPVYDLLTAEATACGDAVQVKLVWRGREPIPPTTSIFVQLLNPSGQLITQADGPPLGLRSDVMPWRGRDIVDLRVLPLSEGQEPAQVLVGVYDYVTGERLTGVDGTTRPLADNAFALPVTHCP